MVAVPLNRTVLILDSAARAMSKNSATLRLTEPVIFLRCGADSSSRRRRTTTVDRPPALLRAILTLKLVKPTRVNSIDVVFEGVSKTDWPDGELTTLIRRL